MIPRGSAVLLIIVNFVLFSLCFRFPPSQQQQPQPHHETSSSSSYQTFPRSSSSGMGSLGAVANQNQQRPVPLPLTSAEIQATSDMILNALPAPPPGYSDTPPIVGGGGAEMLWPRPKNNSINSDSRSQGQGNSKPSVAEKPKLGSGTIKDVESTL